MRADCSPGGSNFDAEAETINNCINFVDFRKPSDSKSPRTVKELQEMFLGGELDGLVMDMEGNVGSHFGTRLCVVLRA